MKIPMRHNLRKTVNMRLNPHLHGDRASRSERGQALILIVFAIIGLVGITALAVDGGSAYSDRRHAQNAADSAALAGALTRINGGQWVNTVRQVAATNGYSGNGASSVVEIHSPPISGAYKGNIEYIQVRITSHVRTYFASVIGMRQLTNVVESVARSKPSVYGPMFDGASVVSLAPASDCVNHKAFYVHSEATLDIWGSGVFSNSNNPTCALIQQAEGSIRINDNHPIQVVGGASIQKPRLITPYPPQTNAGAMSYPPPIFMPKVSCGQKEASILPDGHTISSGNWGGDDFPPPDVTWMESGVYCLDGDFVLNGGQLTGNNILIYMKRGQLRLSGTSVINVSALHAGKNDGLLIYQPIENKHPMILNAGEGSSIQGAILAPGADIKIKGNDSKYGFHSQIIGYTVDVDGTSNIIMKYVDNENWYALTMPQVQLAK
jgi:hypothetical protein